MKKILSTILLSLSVLLSYAQSEDGIFETLARSNHGWITHYKNGDYEKYSINLNSDNPYEDKMVSLNFDTYDELVSGLDNIIVILKECDVYKKHTIRGQKASCVRGLGKMLVFDAPEYAAGSYYIEMLDLKILKSKLSN